MAVIYERLESQYFWDMAEAKKQEKELTKRANKVFLTRSHIKRGFFIRDFHDTQQSESNRKPMKMYSVG